MEPGFRGAMSWLHTWAGLALGSVLLAVFWMGSLAVFDREIDRWMMPATRLPAPVAAPLLDPLLLPELTRLPAGTPACYARLPDERTPVLLFAWREGGTWRTRHFDPADGTVLPEPGTLGGSRFLYPFHYSLHLHAAGLGHWIVGIAAMAMLALLVSGVVIHVRLFADFFTFRPRAAAQRARLDLHALAGVAVLPFHAVITLSGLAIFFAVYFPSVRDVAFRGDRQAFSAEAYGVTGRAKAGEPAAMASLDAMVAEAGRRWGGGAAGLVWITNPGDANAAVLLRRNGADRVGVGGEPILFAGATGAVLGGHAERPVMGVQRFLSGLHMIQFRHWTIRWLYFLAGLAGCVMIATGFLLWLGARRRRGGRGLRLVEALAVASTTGIVIATLAFLVANRLLPTGAAAGPLDRAGLEVAAFAAAWIAATLHVVQAGWRAWSSQARAIAILAVLAVALNWLTTGDHPLRARPAVLGVDLVLLAIASIAWTAARRLARRAAPGEAGDG